MCGIGGLLGTTLPPDELRHRLKLMSADLVHRGPDDEGFLLDVEAGLAVMHRRLSIVDLSATGHQPMTSPDGRYVITFNGEIYNFESLRALLADRGHRFRGSSDTEVLLHAITEWGVERSLEQTVGMFAFGLWDRKCRILYLARDRLGEKPLSLAKLDSGIAFASELSALRAANLIDTSLDRDALALYAKYAHVPAPYTIYRGVRKIMPGTVVAITASDAPAEIRHWAPVDDHGSLRMFERRYWDARSFVGAADELAESRDQDELDSALLRRLEEAIQMQMQADVPVGAFLSGGIDSSLVCAVAQSVSRRPVKTFTIGFDDDLFDESPFAARVAEHLGTEHRTVRVSAQDLLDTVPKLAALSDEPFADPSQLPTYVVSRIAREEVTVCLTGDGGDELFGGYNRYIEPMRLHRYTSRIPPAAAKLLARPLRLLPAGEVDRFFALMAGTFGQKRFRVQSPGRRVQKLADLLMTPEPQSQYELLMSHWAPERLLFPPADAPEIETGLEWDWPRFARHAMLWDIAHYLPDNNLVKVDRAGMAVSLETRLPLLDHRIVELALATPVSAHISGGLGKQLLRRALGRFLPQRLIDRPKMGFSVPLAAWLRGPLREWAEDLLSPASIAQVGMFEPKPVRECWKAHLSGRADHYLRLWLVLQAHAWHFEAARPESMGGTSLARESSA